MENENNKRIIFWIDGAFTNFCVSYFLQKKINANFFCIIDSSGHQKSFFENQKLVNFRKKWFYHDNISLNFHSIDYDFLKKFEKKYNINLWKLAINERIFYRFNRIHKFQTEEILSILEDECKLFDKILTETNPDFFITKEPPLHHHEIFYEMCRSKGVKILMLNIPHIGKCIISEEAKIIDNNESEFKITRSKNRTFDELKEFLDELKMSKTIEKFSLKYMTSKKTAINAIFRFLFSKNISVNTHYSYIGRNKRRVIVDSLIQILKKYFRKYYIDHNLKKLLNSSIPFVYFPLAMDEERNLLIAAPFYTGQIEIIKNVARSLPVGYKLFVKETPGMVFRKWRKISEYKEIMDIPNVELYHPSLQSDLFLNNCSLVFTIGGSSSLEAAFYKKPSISLTKYGFSVISSIKLVQNFEELANAISDSLNSSVSNDELDRYVSLLEKNLIDFDLIGFESSYQNYFYQNGYYLDIEIDEKQMKSFIDSHHEELEYLSEQFVKRII